MLTTKATYLQLRPEGPLPTLDHLAPYMAIVVIDGSRVRAIAMQLRGADGRWTMEALQVG